MKTRLYLICSVFFITVAVSCSKVESTGPISAQDENTANPTATRSGVSSIKLVDVTERYISRYTIGVNGNFYATESLENDFNIMKIDKDNHSISNLFSLDDSITYAHKPRICVDSEENVYLGLTHKGVHKYNNAGILLQDFTPALQAMYSNDIIIDDITIATTNNVFVLLRDANVSYSESIIVRIKPNGKVEEFNRVPTEHGYGMALHKAKGENLYTTNYLYSENKHSYTQFFTNNNSEPITRDPGIEIGYTSAGMDNINLYSIVNEKYIYRINPNILQAIKVFELPMAVEVNNEIIPIAYGFYGNPSFLTSPDGKTFYFYAYRQSEDWPPLSRYICIINI